MNPRDAIHMRYLLTEDLHSNAYMHRVVESTYRSMKGQPSEIGYEHAVPNRALAGHWSSSSAMIDHMLSALKMAETFYLSMNMGRIARVASERLPDDEPIHAHDPYSPSGFIYFEEPFTTLDIRGMPNSYDAALWNTRGGNAVIWMFTDKNNAADGPNAMMRSSLGDEGWARLPRLTFAGGLWTPFGQPSPMRVSWDHPLTPEVAAGLRIKIGDVGGGKTAMSWVGPQGEALDIRGGPTVKPDDTMRFLHAVWRISQQTLAEVTKEEAPRQMRRQLQRRQIPTGVQVIRLRRRKGHATGTGEPLAWRQLVTGHWKNQWYPSLGIHQRIYVDPYVRGPEDAPFSQTEIVRAIVR